jgi:hypothetical protein
MTQLNCEITASRADGSFRWRRAGAQEPSGWIDSRLVPIGVSIGSEVVIDFDNNYGRLSPVSCRLKNKDQVQALTETDSQLSTEKIDDTHKPGRVFWVNIMNPLEDEHSQGKLRPAVLVSQLGDHWRVMGLTRKSTYMSGEHRRAIPNYATVGLSGPGFIWGRRLTRVTADSIHGLIGSANHQLIEEIVDIARDDLSYSEIDDLRSITRSSVHNGQGADANVNNANIKQLNLTAESLCAFLEANNQIIRQDISDYFLSGNFTGRHFEYFSRISNPFFFDGNDIAALMCLSISPKANVASDLLSLALRRNFVIQQGERESPIWMRPVEEYVPGSWFHDLFDELCKIPNISSVVASKLMASKFPHSIPIYDNDVSALLNHPQQWWMGWHNAMQSPQFRQHLTGMRESLGLHEVSLLRIADVALWMEAQRRKRVGLL